MPKKTHFLHFLKRNLLFYNLDRVKVFAKSKIESMKEEIDSSIINNFFLSNQRHLFSLKKDTRETSPILETQINQSTLTYELNQRDFSHEISIQRGFDQGNKIFYNIETESHTNEAYTVISPQENNFSWSNCQSIKIDSGDLFTIKTKTSQKFNQKTSNFSELAVSDFAFSIKSFKSPKFVVKREILLEKDHIPACCNNECRII